MGEATGQRQRLEPAEIVMMLERVAVVAQASLGIVSDEEIAAYFDTVEFAETVGPLFDPTAFMRRDHRQVETNVRLVRAFATWRKAAQTAIGAPREGQA